MMRYLVPMLSLALLLVACTGESGPPVVISDVRILEPMPGTNMGVGYLKMTNNSDSAITVRSASSPDFGRVEIHQTTIADGVSRMRPLNEVQIDAGATVTFEPGGRHLMLFDPKPGIAPGSPVSLEVTHNKGLLIVSATMQTRLPAE